VRDPDQVALVAAARRGDKGALATLVRRHRPMLVAVCRGALGQADLAEDAAQEALLLALTSLDRKVRLHAARARLRGWLGPHWREERMTVDDATGSVEMQVVDVRRGPATEDVPERHVVLLEEVGGGGRLHIWVGPFEGIALAMALQGAELPRPDSFRFMAGLLAATGGTLREIRVTRLVGSTFHGEAVVDSAAGERRVDARPSDALNLALLLGAPIRVDPAVIDDAAGRPIPWDRAVEDLPSGAAEIVAERQAAWDQAREAMARAVEQAAQGPQDPQRP
jgi:uncharacterized protein